MILTNRKIPKELLYFRALEKRAYLNSVNQTKRDLLEKGYAGELLYDSIYDEVVSHLYVFRDIYLKIENSILQCDTLIVSDQGFIINEIKNFRGIYNYENEKWYVRQREISEDPISQLKRTTNKLIKFKYMYNEKFISEGKVIFPNPDFSLESNHPTLWDYVIVRHQLRRYLYSLDDLQAGQRAKDLSEIIQKHIVENPYFDYSSDLSEVKKGVYCRACTSFNLTKIKFHFVCDDCKHKDTVHTIILQALSDFNILFNKNFISRQELYDFLDGQISRSTLNRYFLKYCKRISNGRSSKHMFKYYDFNDAMMSEMRVWRYKDMPINSVTKTH